MWIAFGAVVAVMLVLDLGVLHRKSHALSLREALAWCIAWVSLAALFGVAVYLQQGSEKALEFAAGYIIEWSLSVDNLFVFLVIFAYFAVPAAYQHRVLFWGIMGAVIMRGLFVAAGVALLAWFHWMIYVFGAFLVITGIKLLRPGEMQIEPERNPILRVFRKVMPVTAGYHGQHFFVREGGRWMATPLVAVLIVVETTDVIFAVDSVPAILAITTDPFIVYTSNVFAILGLRALFFLLAGIMGLFRYLKFGLSLVLIFVGVKMLVADFYKIPTGISLTVVVSILATSVLASVLIRPRLAPAPVAGNPEWTGTPHGGRNGDTEPDGQGEPNGTPGAPSDPAGTRRR